MTVDLAILGDPYTDKKSTLSMPGAACEGLYKLLQKVIVLLLTDEDAPYNIGVGTDLPSVIFAANITDKDSLAGLFQIGLSSIRETIQAQTPFDTPEEEQLKDFTVAVQDGETADSLEALITVISVAEGTVSATVPVTNLFTSQE